MLWHSSRNGDWKIVNQFDSLGYGNKTYTHASRFFVTISKQRIRSSARYMLRSVSASNGVNSIGNKSHRTGRTEETCTVRSASMKFLTLKITGKWSRAVWMVLQRFVAVCRESTRKHTDVPKHTFKRLVNWIRDLSATALTLAFYTYGCLTSYTTGIEFG